MPRPYSTDLRQRALLACERGRLSRARIAVLFGVGEPTLYRWQQQARTEGRRTAQPARGGPPARPGGKGPDGPAAAAGWQGPARPARPGGRGERLDAGGICRSAGRAHRSAGNRLDLVPGAQAAGPGAHKTFRAEEQARADLAQERAAWRAELARVAPERLVFLDESGIDTRLTRTHARAVRGKRALGTVPWGHWKRPTVIGALARDGVIACMG